MGRGPDRGGPRLARPGALARLGRVPYVLQAAMASLQMEDSPDWREIAALYGELVRLTGSPVAELNRAVAVGEIHGPEAAHRSLAIQGQHRQPLGREGSRWRAARHSR